MNHIRTYKVGMQKNKLNSTMTQNELVNLEIYNFGRRNREGNGIIIFTLRPNFVEYNTFNNY